MFVVKLGELVIWVNNTSKQQYKEVWYITHCFWLILFLEELWSSSLKEIFGAPYFIQNEKKRHFIFMENTFFSFKWIRN